VKETATARVTMDTRIYLLEEVDDTGVLPVESPLLQDADESFLADHPLCSACLDTSRLPPHDLIFQGFDDLHEVNAEVTAFLPGGPPLVATAEYARQLADLLVGCSLVRVGFSEWNQQYSLAGEARFRKATCFGGLYVTGVCTDASDNARKQIPRCSSCGRLRPLRWFSRSSQQLLFPRLNAWDGSDVFLLEGMSQELGTIVTEEGRAKMAKVGFTNLRLIELAWAS